jgi:hypothetical protein
MGAVLWTNVLFLTVVVPKVMSAPPPTDVVTLVSNVHSSIVAVPPALMLRAPPLEAVLSPNVHWLTFNVVPVPTWIPPPRPALSPLAIVKPERFKVPAVRSMTRTAPFPLTTMIAAPGPTMVRDFAIVSEVASAMDPLSPGAKSIVPPGGVLAMASRSDPGLLSLRFVTVNAATPVGRHSVAATTRCAQTSPRRWRIPAPWS